MSSSNSESMFSKQREADDRDARVLRSLKKIKRKFLIMSGKGGVGKTSLSVNLSIALANKGHKVGLVDVDIHGPDVPRMLGITDKIKESVDRRMVPVPYNKNLNVISIQSLIPNPDDAIVITTPQEVALADVRKSLNFCKNTYMDIFGILENMSGFHCPHCNKVIDLYGSGGGKKTAIATNNRFLGKIPFDVNMVACGDKGISFQTEYPDSEVTKAFQDIAEKMVTYK